MPISVEIDPDRPAYVVVRCRGEWTEAEVLTACEDLEIACRLGCTRIAIDVIAAADAKSACERLAKMDVRRATPVGARIAIIARSTPSSSCAVAASAWTRDGRPARNFLTRATAASWLMRDALG
jgi:hypothetical protein